MYKRLIIFIVIFCLVFSSISPSVANPFFVPFMAQPLSWKLMACLFIAAGLTFSSTSQIEGVVWKWYQKSSDMVSHVYDSVMSYYNGVYKVSNELWESIRNFVKETYSAGVNYLTIETWEPFDFDNQEKYKQIRFGSYVGTAKLPEKIDRRYMDIDDFLPYMYIGSTAIAGGYSIAFRDDFYYEIDNVEFYEVQRFKSDGQYYAVFNFEYSRYRFDGTLSYKGDALVSFNINNFIPSLSDGLVESTLPQYGQIIGHPSLQDSILDWEVSEPQGYIYPDVTGDIVVHPAPLNPGVDEVIAGPASRYIVAPSGDYAGYLNLDSDDVKRGYGHVVTGDKDVYYPPIPDAPSTTWEHDVPWGDALPGSYPGTVSESITVAPDGTVISRTLSRTTFPDMVVDILTDTHINADGKRVPNQLDFSPLLVIGDLSHKFPFSLPWDLRRGLEYLSASDVEAPVFDFGFYFPYIGNVVYEIDLSMWDDLAVLSRSAISFLFPLFLILGTRRLIGGDV